MRLHASSPRFTETLDQPFQRPCLVRLQLRTCLQSKILHSKDLPNYQYRQFQTFNLCCRPEIWPISLRRRSKHQQLLQSPRSHSLKRSQLHKVPQRRLCRPIWVICWHLSRLKVSSLVRQVHQSMAPTDMHHHHHLSHKPHQLSLQASNNHLLLMMSSLHRRL